jgi:hypothetical protein
MRHDFVVTWASGRSYIYSTSLLIHRCAGFQKLGCGRGRQGRKRPEIRKTSAFASVSRNWKPGAGMLVIDGTITKYEEGKPMMRLFIGMGAGSSLFEADVLFRDEAGREVWAD